MFLSNMLQTFTGKEKKFMISNRITFLFVFNIFFFVEEFNVSLAYLEDY